ncbi:MAG: hypothetical protein LRS46_03955 [Desulfurococcales archaeon]|nr:hypothetical protein [Desulfurococcales archaeon]
MALNEAGMGALGEILERARMVVKQAPLRGPRAAEYARILRRINIRYVPPESIPVQIKFDVFRELAKREAIDFVINRITLKASYIGFEEAEFDDIQRALAYLHALGFAKARVKQRLISCPRCGSNRLIAQLVCPNCGSRLLRRVKLIHHKLCGYIGREDEFEEAAAGSGVESPGGLLCPRCKMPLRTEGVDYEVVGEAFLCEVCGTLTRRPGTAFVCLSCGNEFTITNALYKGLLAAEPTREGVEAWRLSALETSMLIDEMERRGIKNIQVPARLRLRPPPGTPPGLERVIEALARISKVEKGRPTPTASVTVDTIRRYGDLDAFVSSTLTWFLFDSFRRSERCAFILFVDTDARKTAEMMRGHGVIYSLFGQVKALGRELMVLTVYDVSDSLISELSERRGVGVVLIVPVTGNYSEVSASIKRAADLAAAILGYG